MLKPKIAITALSVLTLVGISSPALAKHGHGGLDHCLKAVSKIKSGDFVKVEYLAFTDERVKAYEIEVRDKEGHGWEFECSARDASILEMEREAESADDPLFKNRMKVSEKEARKTATALYPGTVEEVEYEIESNGEPVYELDIVDSEGTEYKVEVSAVSGEIVEVQIETWEIGGEDQVND